MQRYLLVDVFWIADRDIFLKFQPNFLLFYGLQYTLVRKRVNVYLITVK